MKYINDKIINNKNIKMEINKEELIKQLQKML